MEYPHTFASQQLRNSCPREEVSFTPLSLINSPLYMVQIQLEFSDIIGALGLLTYTIGALIYGLPIPFRGVKQWAPRLVGDGIYIAFWVAVYSTIMAFAEQIASTIGSSWSSYYPWLYQTNTFITNIYIVVQGASGLLSLVYVNYAMLSLASFFLSLEATLFAFLIAFSLIIQQNWGLFTSIGVLLMAIPFRIGRSAGATLIGFSMAFYIGLPLLPHFLNLIQFNQDNIQNILSSLEDMATGNSLAWLIQYLLEQNIAYDLIGVTAYLTLLLAISAGLSEAVGEYSGRSPLGLEIVL